MATVGWVSLGQAGLFTASEQVWFCNNYAGYLMYDLYESQIDNQEEKEEKVRRWPVRGVACLLLAVMICGVISTPLAAFLFWNNSRQERPVSSDPVTETTSEEETGPNQGINRIAYITLDQQLATIAPDGTGQNLLTTGSRFFQFPAWSPDGSNVAVIGTGENEVGVYVAPDTTGTELQVLYESVDEAPFYLYWSPDSDRVTFLANHPGGIGLHIAGVLEGASRLLATGQPFYWDWTPSGDRILIHTGISGEDSRLAIIDPAGDGSGDNISEPGFFQAPGIAASGRFWAYAQLDEEDNTVLTILDAESRQPLQTEPHLGQIAMGWNPISDVLAYITPGINAPVYYGPLSLLEATTGESRLLTGDLVIAFFWSPNGRYIAYFTVANLEDGAIQAGTGGKQEGVSKSDFRQEDELYLAVWIADTHEGSIRRLRTFEPTDLFLFQFLPFFDQYSLSHRIWSPDSQSLILPITEEGRSQLFILPIDGNGARPIVDGMIGFWSQQ
jgi:TolB protein